MGEEKVWFYSGRVRLEGLLDGSSADRGVVLCHPHPLYGGDMHNKVVQALAEAYRERNYCTLRFNFRSVGNSEGAFDEGRGEQEDIRAALQFLSELGMKHIDLAGYSFGAWVIAMALENLPLADRVIMVSPPVSFIDFGFLGYNEKIQMVIVGVRDEIADFKAVKKMLPHWNPEAGFHTIEGADHFYWGKTGELKKCIHGFLDHEKSHSQ